MKRTNRLAACFGALVFTALLATPARANLWVDVIDASGSHLFNDLAGSQTGIGSNFINASFSDADFVVSLHIATSNAPGTSVAQLHIDSIVQATTAGTTSQGTSGGTGCVACGVGFNMQILVSDTAFTMPIGPGTLTQSVDTNTAPASAATGKAVFNGFQVNGSATNFATGPNTTGTTTFNSFAVTNVATQSNGLFTSVAPFTLTEMVQLNLTNTNQGQATANLTFAGVPEPSSIVLMGSIVLGLTAAFRKKQLKRQA